MSEFRDITEEESAKFVMIIESIMAKCEKLFEENFDGPYELGDLLRTIALGRFNAGSKRLYGELSLSYDQYRSTKTTVSISHMCYELWAYTNPAIKRDQMWDVFSHITDLKNKYESNASLLKILDSLYISLMCFIQLSLQCQLYQMKRELANTKENARKEMDVLTDELERTKAELAATQTYEGKRTKSDLDAAKNIYICPSDNTVDLRNLLSRMKCLL
jgi:hypothetical protein